MRARGKWLHRDQERLSGAVNQASINPGRRDWSESDLMEFSLVGGHRYGDEELERLARGIL